ncbi:WRKY [Musa troglodytarum]|uniref:WRKY n=1 Tax=Musa troglodytarum TaxID=320322 RepID=A0A9E7EA91_9LILI|nr:WRKY [Musa troglodytarum]
MKSRRDCQNGRETTSCGNMIIMQPLVELKRPEKKQLMENKIIDSVIQEMEQAFDRTAKLQSLVELVNCSDTEKESALVVLEEILQSCNATRSMLNSGGAIAVPRRNSAAIELASQDLAALQVPMRRDPRSYEREEITATPYNDGYQWRKYGEKSIKGCTFKRSYYRCTYSHDQRCNAKKQVQQQDCGAPFLFLVVYKGEHTCTPSWSTAEDAQLMLQDFPTARRVQLQDYDEQPFGHITAVTPPVEPCLLRFDSTEHSKRLPSHTNRTRRSVVEGTTMGFSSSKVESEADSMEPPQPSLSAICGFYFDTVLDEVSSPCSVGLDMDFLEFRF